MEMNLALIPEGVVNAVLYLSSSWLSEPSSSFVGGCVIGSDNESLDPTPSEMYGEDNQLNVIKKLFEINWDKLNSELGCAVW